MSVREYIGARYVPVFAEPAEWDATKTYEPLTVVMYQGSSYTSRQAVPANISIENETYWALTGNYNAQIEQYRQEVAVFDQRITQNASDIDTLEAKLPTASFSSTNTVKKYVDDKDTAVRTAFAAADTQIRTDFAAADTQIRTDFAAADTALKNELTARSNFVLFGDSWAAFNEGFQNWYDIANIGNVLHTNLKNFAAGGARFTGTSNLISSQITTASNSMTTAEKNNTKYVVIVGGVNDHTNSASNNGLPDGITYRTWGEAVRSACSTASTAFPNALVVYAPNICDTGYGLEKAANIFNNVRNLHYDFPWNNGSYIMAPNLPYFFIGFSGTSIFTTDLLHLNNHGAQAFGKCVLSACIGCASQPLGISTTLHGMHFHLMNNGSFNIFMDSVTLPQGSTNYTLDNTVSSYFHIIKYVTGGSFIFQITNGNINERGFVRINSGSSNPVSVLAVTTANSTYYGAI